MKNYSLYHSRTGAGMMEDGTVSVLSQPVKSVAEDSQARFMTVCHSSVEVVSDTVLVSTGRRIPTMSQVYSRMNFAQARAVIWGFA